MILPKEYILGLIEGEGSFTNDRSSDGKTRPMFSLKMHVRDKDLVNSVMETMGLYTEHNHKVYEYKHSGRHYVFMVIRDLYCLKNKIVPFFKGNLFGYKGKEFEYWLKKFSYLNSLQYRNSGRLPNEYYEKYAPEWPIPRNKKANL